VWSSRLPRMMFRPQQSTPDGDVLIVVFQRGGADCLNMVPPYGEGPNYFGRRPTIGIPAPDSSAANKALDLDGFFGLHPALGAPEMGNWIDWYEKGMLAIVHAAHMDNPSRSHFDAMTFMERGTPGEKRIPSGWMGRHLAGKSVQNGSPFRAVGIGTMLQTSLRGDVPAVTLQTILDFRLQGREAEIGRFQQDLERLCAGDSWLDLEGQGTFAALDMLVEKVGSDEYEPEHGARYNTDDRFNRGLMQIAQLIKADVGLEVACVDINGWDHHANEVDPDDPALGTMANMLQRMAGGITAFLTDLGDHQGDGSGPGVTIVTMSEFGRRAYENGNLGTDHGHGSVMFLLGRAVKGGQVFTNPWPGLAEDDLYRGDLAGTTEYRDVLGEILSKRRGEEALDTVFPDHEFNFPGLLNELVVQPTPTPTETATPRPENEIFLPYAGKE